MLALTSDRIYLRRLTTDDATAAYAAWLNDPDVNRFLEIRHQTHTVESCREFIAETSAQSNQHLFGIFLAENRRHVGNVKLGFIDNRNLSGQISLFLGDKSIWGQGHGTEAIRLVTCHGFTDLGLERIEAGIYERNLGSLRAFLKLGYTVEGFFRGSHIFEGRRTGSFWVGVLKHEWQHGDR